MVEKVKESVKFLNDKGIIDPEIGIILGTGLGQMIDSFDIIETIGYEEIPHFPVSTVEFHSGKLIHGRLNGKSLLAMQGRFHYYEGYELDEITFPIRVMKMLGIKYLFISNAGGAMNLDMKKGELMLITDHINLIPGSPLRGKEYREFGSRFVDLSRPYSEELNEKIRENAHKLNLQIHQGVYVAVSGPHLETRAEYRYLKNAGADVVGMSTAPEVIVANQMKLPVAAISVVTDECDPNNLAPIKIEEIIEAAGIAEKKLVRLFEAVIREL
ncbi:MAG: purine-nucleoside phosphorylase [Bacteroidota bacterium]|nr:purine-nucleoside phosphorylase [Bacteroidota bacterium]